jgi:MoxR-like ATPase
VNIDQTQRLIVHLYCAALQGRGLPTMTEMQGGEPICAPSEGPRRNRYVPTMIWGEAGIGKSETVKRVADDLGIGFVDLRLAQLDAGDLIGLPRQEKVYPCVYDWKAGAPASVLARRYSQAHLGRYVLNRYPELAEGKSLGEVINEAVALAENSDYSHMIDFQMVYSTPVWFPAPNTHGILFLDELNRAPMDVRQVIFQLVLDRRMHTLELPDGWIVLSANNPPTPEYGEVQTTDDKAFQSRFLHIGLEPKPEEWLQYAYATGIDPSIRSVISTQSDLLGLKKVQMADSFPTPRTWVMLNNIAPGLDRDLVFEVASGLVGPHAAAAWAKLRRMPDEPVRAIDVANDYESVRRKLHRFTSYPEPQFHPNGDPQLDATGAQVTKISNRNDMIAVTFDGMIDVLKGGITDQQAQNIAAFLVDSLKSIEEGGLSMGDVGRQYIKFWMVDAPGAMAKVQGLVTGPLATFLMEAGQMAKVARAQAGTSRRRRRGPPGGNFGALPPAAHLGVGEWAFGTQAPTPANQVPIFGAMRQRR